MRAVRSRERPRSAAIAGAEQRQRRERERSDGTGADERIADSLGQGKSRVHERDTFNAECLECFWADLITAGAGGANAGQTRPKRAPIGVRNRAKHARSRARTRAFARTPAKGRGLEAPRGSGEPPHNGPRYFATTGIVVTTPVAGTTRMPMTPMDVEAGGANSIVPRLPLVSGQLALSVKESCPLASSCST